VVVAVNPSDIVDSFHPVAVKTKTSPHSGVVVNQGSMTLVVMVLVLLAGCNGAASKQEELASNKAGANSSNSSGATAKESPRETSSPTMSDYALIPLDRMIGTAETLVVGEVASVSDATFRANVKEVVAGDFSSKQLEIAQYIPSRFEGKPRAVSYATGQTFLWFLVKDEKLQRPNVWRIMGAGGEGEMPIDDGFVYFPARHIDGLKAEPYRVHGAERTTERFELPAFIDAVKNYRKCFKWEPAKVERPKPVAVCDQATLDQLAKTSVAHKYLVTTTLNRGKTN
jgi:hypothetical protein